VILMTLMAAQGCYTYVPVESTTPPMGRTVAFEISDQGRASIADRMGPGITSIEGRLLGTEGDQLVISVFGVETIRNGRSSWSGETVRLNRAFVSRVRERQLSKTKTWLVSAAVTAAVVALVVATDLTGAFTGDDDDGENGGGPADVRPRPQRGPVR
jgi:hypothetical protein